MKIPKPSVLYLAAGLGLAGTAGGLGAVAISGASSQQTPSKTVTINVENGATGPQGPIGPPGPKGDTGPAGTGGAENCPTGSTFGELIINHPGGQVSIYTCIKD